MDDSLSLAASDAEELSGSYHDPAPLYPAQAWTPIFSASCLTLWRRVWNGLPQRNRSVATWMNGSCRSAARPLVNNLHHSSQSSTMRSPNLDMHPTRPAYVPLLPLPSLRSKARKEKGYDSLPPLDESVAAHLCPPTASGRKAKAAHPSKLCRMTSATKMTAQAIGRSMASLVELERYLWLNLTEMKDVDKVPFLDSPVSPTGLFGPAVEGFSKRFITKQKSSQAMRHFLPKRPSSAAASSHPKMGPTQQPAKAAPPAV